MMASHKINDQLKQELDRRSILGCSALGSKSGFIRFRRNRDVVPAPGQSGCCVLAQRVQGTAKDSALSQPSP